MLGLASWAEGNPDGGVRAFGEARTSLRLAGNLTDTLSTTLVLADMLQYCKTLKGLIYGGMNPRASMPMLLSMYRNGNLKLDELLTRRYRLDQINDAFTDMREGRNIRGIIEFD